VNELVFEVTQDADGGFSAECLSESIFTQADTWDELRANVREAVEAFTLTGRNPAESGFTLSGTKCSRLDEAPPRFERTRACRRPCRHWGYIVVNQVGSPGILQTDEPTSHRAAVPAHKALRVGTLSAILRDVAEHKGVSRQSILESV
jgi:predicted RNA binding protein YcfA (HicA-like mRNA interferase family)